MSQSWNPPPPPGISGSAPDNNLVFGIIATVVSVMFCCIPHGLISLIIATQVNKKAAMGDYVGAASSAKQAKTWAIISIIVSVIGLAIAFILGFLGALLDAMA